MYQGMLLIKGKHVTGFTDTEEDEVGLSLTSRPSWWKTIEISHEAA